MDQLQELLRRASRLLEEYRDLTFVRWIGYAVIMGLGFMAALNLVVGLIAVLQGEWLVGLGLVLLGGGFILGCEALFDFLIRQDDSSFG